MGHGMYIVTSECDRHIAYCIPYHTVSYHTIPYHTIPYHTIPYHTIPYYTIPYHTIPYHTISYRTIPYHTIPYHAMPCHVIPYLTNRVQLLCREVGDAKRLGITRIGMVDVDLARAVRCGVVG